MIALTLLCCLAAATRPGAAVDPAPNPVARFSQDDEVDAAIRAAGEDLAALFALATEYGQGSQAAAARRVYERVVELDPDNERAREALRHHRYDGRWFETYVELAKYKREEEARMKEQGLVRWKEDWVPEGDLAFLRMGFVRDGQQTWAHPADAARAAQVAEWEAAGYRFRADDSSWIAPEDFEQWTALLWKCGDEWVDMEAANAFHANAATPWELTGEHFQVRTTCAWNYGNAARWHADQVHAHLVRLFGVEPATRPTLLVLNSLDQYNTAAGGVMIDSEGLSSLHGAYFADGALDASVQPTRYSGIGVSYWEAGDPKVEGWGPFWVRWAAAQSFVEALDPSWNAASTRVVAGANGDLQSFGAQFWGEKRIPRWLRYGAASYVERFLPNPQAAEGADPWDLRTFAFAELKKDGGLRQLPEVFTFRLTLQDTPGSTRLYSEAGLLVSFLLDGSKDDADLQAKLENFRSALALPPGGTDGDAVAAAARELEAGLVERSEAIRAFAGL